MWYCIVNVFYSGKFHVFKVSNHDFDHRVHRLLLFTGKKNKASEKWSADLNIFLLVNPAVKTGCV